MGSEPSITQRSASALSEKIRLSPERTRDPGPLGDRAMSEVHAIQRRTRRRAFLMLGSWTMFLVIGLVYVGPDPRPLSLKSIDMLPGLASIGGAPLASLRGRTAIRSLRFGHDHRSCSVR